jgi:methylenetetrahydrofolate reductase (NADPH)
MATFREAVRNKDFVVSAQIFLQPETTAAMIGEQAKLLHGKVDGVLLTDNQSGQLHLSPLAAASLLLACDVDPIVQLTCRNRNRIALLAELLGAAALGVSSLVCVRGNRVPEGFNPRPKAVFDLSAAELIEIASKMKADERIPALPDLYVGSVITPHTPEPGWQPRKLTAKADAGAQFVQTHICMDPEMLRGYMKHLVAVGLTRRLSFFVSLAIFSSADDARWLRDSLPNNCIPEELIERLDRADDAEQEGIRICAEQLQQLVDIPGINGVHLIATRHLPTIPEVIAAAGIS